MKVKDRCRFRTDILIAIPSKGRAYDLGRGIFRWIRDIGWQWKVFVEPQDEIYYKQVLDPVNLEKMSKNDMGMGYVMGFIAKFCLLNNYKYVFKIDDDTTGFISKDIGNMKVGHSNEILNKFFTEVLPDLEKDPRLGAVRITNGRIHLFEKLGKNRKYTHKNCPLWHGWIIRPEILVNLNEKIKINEDIASYLYCLKGGYYTLGYGQAGINFKTETNPGGLQMFDRNELAKQTVKYLKRDFPDLALKRKGHRLELDFKPYQKKYQKSLP